MSTHPMVTRAKAGIFKPLERMNCHVTTTSPLPRSHVHALRDLTGKKLIQQGIDCDETFSPVVKPATIRTVLSLAVSREAHMQKCNPCKTLVDTESKLGPDGDPISDPTLYRNLAGAL
ncbi:ribonuclease H-like domain-containing protein [Tanacetum coccineum]